MIRAVPENTETDKRPLLSVDDIAARLAIKPSRVYELARSGQLQSVRIGDRQVRFHEDDLAKYIKGGRHGA